MVRADGPGSILTGLWRGLNAWIQVLATFALLNLAMGLIDAGRDANWLWIGLADRGGFWVGALLFAFAAGALVPTRFDQRRWARGLARIAAAGLAIGCAVDVVGYYGALSRGGFTTSVPVPLSALIASSLLTFAVVGRPPPRPMRYAVLRALTLRGAIAGVWVGLLVGSIASTDYGRSADVIVVFGARVHADGRLSDALADRVRTGVDLYRAGRAPRLLFSGGRDSGATLSEPEAMRAFAIEAGVPSEAIILDETGRNTRATVVEVARRLNAAGWRSTLMVSHDYHLARVKLFSHRIGLRAFTVPAQELRPLRAGPYYVARELVAFVWYWLR